MPSFDSYLTVAKSASDEFTEKKSRFIGYVSPVHSADEALEFVKQIKKKHNDARHNCFAYRLLDGGERYSDDGEPQGTAGQPMLEVLQRENIYECAVVVTRYFGGVLLGTGGLSRAYTLGAKVALAAAQVVKMIKAEVCEFSFDYALYGSVQTLLSKYEIKLLNSDFSEIITLEFAVKPEKFDGFCSTVTELTAGKGKIIKKSEKYMSEF